MQMSLIGKRLPWSNPAGLPCYFKPALLAQLILVRKKHEQTRWSITADNHGVKIARLVYRTNAATAQQIATKWNEARLRPKCQQDVSKPHQKHKHCVHPSPLPQQFMSSWLLYVLRWYVRPSCYLIVRWSHNELRPRQNHHRRSSSCVQQTSLQD
jgi:hypothetical protein